MPNNNNEDNSFVHFLRRMDASIIQNITPPTNDTEYITNEVVEEPELTPPDVERTVWRPSLDMDFIYYVNPDRGSPGSDWCVSPMREHRVRSVEDMTRKIVIERTERGFHIKANFSNFAEFRGEDKFIGKAHLFNASSYNEVSESDSGIYSLGIHSSTRSTLLYGREYHISRAYENFSNWTKHIRRALKTLNIKLITVDYERPNEVTPDISDGSATYPCDECNKESVKNLLHYNSHYDAYFCEECHNNIFVKCTECNKSILKDSVHHSNSGEAFCYTCYEAKYIRCNDCGEEILRADSLNPRGSRYSYCTSCYANRFVDCGRCGVTIQRHNSCTREGQSLCGDCFELLDNKHIRRYDYKPNPVFYGDKNSIHLGIELEVEGGFYNVIDKIDDERMYFKHDGSLRDGFEIVTHPMSYPYLKETKLFENTLRELRKGGCKALVTCGMHIHISKSIFTSLHLFKLMKLVYENEYLFLKLAERSKRRADRWASFNEKRQKNIIYYAKEKYKSSKYEAINLCNRSTIEFRFMKSNLALAKFNKNIEIVLSAIEFSRNIGITKCNEDSYLKFISDHRKEYINLYKFALGLHLMNTELLACA